LSLEAFLRSTLALCSAALFCLSSKRWTFAGAAARDWAALARSSACACCFDWNSRSRSAAPEAVEARLAAWSAARCSRSFWLWIDCSCFSLVSCSRCVAAFWSSFCSSAAPLRWRWMSLIAVSWRLMLSDWIRRRLRLSLRQSSTANFL